MYPFDSDETYVRNCWYVAANPSEIAAGPIERTIMDLPVAVFRMADGTPTAMHGVCPHRYYSLAQGVVVGDSLECNYHGFQFDGRSGACTKAPFQNAPPARFRQRIYPTAEHGGLIWIWPGDPALADKDLLPPLEKAGLSDDWAVVFGQTILANGRAQLLVENLLDLTHIEYLHATALTAKGMMDSPVEFRSEADGQAYASRLTKMEWVEHFYDLLYKSEHRFDGAHEVLGSTWYYSPGYLRTGPEIESINGRDDFDRSVYGKFYFHHFLTPATRHSVHYFSGFSRNYRHSDAALNETMLGLDLAVRRQDVDAVEIVEQNLAHPERLVPELLSRSDVPAIKVRRHIQELLKREEGSRQRV